MKADGQRGLLYSCGDDKKLCIIDVNQSKLLQGGVLKISNYHTKFLALEADLKRLYASTLEGVLLVLNVSLTP